jgi:hypothetical protein
VIRHADRTPKQKIKQGTSHPKLMEFFEKHCNRARSEMRLQGEPQFREFILVCDEILAEHPVRAEQPPVVLTRSGQFIRSPPTSNSCFARFHALVDETELRRIEQIRSILANNASGTKLQLRLQPNDTVNALLLICKWGGVLTQAGCRQAATLGERHRKALHHQASVSHVHLLMKNTEFYGSTESRVVQVWLASTTQSIVPTY